MQDDWLIVKGAREHNLKDVNVRMPKGKLIVFTGISGSGKSSLAFNTIYAEGRRRYIESLSSYARQFLGGNEKPNVDQIQGLAPAIAIDQKTRSHNPRSTVGTVTEIYDYLRLLYARVGTPYCVNCNIPIASVTIKEILKAIRDWLVPNDQVLVLAPVVREKKGQFKELFNRLRRENFLRVRINDAIWSLDETIELDKNERHNIDIVVDRVVYQDDDEVWSRLHDGIEVGLEYGKSLIKLFNPQLKEERLYSSSYSCKNCGFKITNLEPRLFSFNAPMGACATCKGLGINLEVDPEQLVPDPEMSINEGGIVFYKRVVNTLNIDWQRFAILLMHYDISLTKPLSQMAPEEWQLILRGSTERIPIKLYTISGKAYEDFNYVEGVGTIIERRYAETPSERQRQFYRSFLTEKTCHTCQGKRLNPSALAVKINNLSIIDFTEMAINEARLVLEGLKLTKVQQQIVKLVLLEINNRLHFLDEVGLNYLTLSRLALTLSGGETQRIRLATQIGSYLTGVLYVLDEPSIGLHQKDNERLLRTLENLRNLGNTLLVVEHDEETIKRADWIVDLGPAAGNNGGNVVFSGPLADIAQKPDSITGQFLTKKLTIPIPQKRRGGNGQVLEIFGAAANNLQKLNVKIPLGKFITVTGVSGSGKSSLVNDVLWRALQQEMHGKKGKKVPFQKLKGIEHLENVINITQDPIGKTPRSIPATYTSVFDDIRDLFTHQPESRARGFTKSRFSFNVPGGRCEHCQGSGIIKINMQFLPDVFVVCEICDGKRYNNETLVVKFAGKNIYDVLNMTFDEAVTFFDSQAKIKDKLITIQAVGLGYLKLGQPSTQLSGGEAQRIKLSTYLLKKTRGHTLFLLDEPTTGLHQYDIAKLLDVLAAIIKQGNSVLVIEHNLDVIKTADYIIDLGPGGGINGGNIIGKGTPEQLANNEHSFTGQYLKKLLK